VQAVKPVAVHTGVGVEPDDIAFRVQGHTAVHITDEAEVGRLAQVLQLAMAFTLPECGYEFGVWTGVVEDDEAMWGAVVCGVLIHAVDALECGLASFENGDEHVDRLLACGLAFVCRCGRCRRGVNTGTAASGLPIRADRRQSAHAGHPWRVAVGRESRHG